MGVSRNLEGTLDIVACKGFCQNNNSSSKCGKGCRNTIDLENIENDQFFSDKIILDFLPKFKGTEKYYKEQVESILNDIY